MTRTHIGPVLAILMIGLTSTAVATTTVCSKSAYKRYHYGQKASLRFDVGRLGPESITNEVKEFAARNGLSYSAVGLHDPYKDPPLEKLDQILQDTSIALSLSIRTSNRSTIATATSRPSLSPADQQQRIGDRIGGPSVRLCARAAIGW